MYSALKAVQIVEAVINEAWRFYQFLSRKDSRVCPVCDRYDLSVMTKTEIEKTFPYLEKVNDMMWLPHVHPNCRCVLMFEEEDEENEKKRKK